MPIRKFKKDEKGEELPGYPLYPEKEDIYNQAKEETEIDPEHPDQLKKPVEGIDAGRGLNELDFEDDVTGGDLDVPGVELDDQQEEIGSEDEENNIYSEGDTD
ncbi:MAG: hypothetical protein K0S33_3924 [Bacteroidetes bacterium]|jgi:hypothetical protein|nr:hypothetical protein [Bacteroidota bacterium]